MEGPHQDFARELQATFRVEAQDHLQSVEAALVTLERSDAAARDALFERLLRTLHTLKGAARAAGRAEIERLCHAQENVISALLGPEAQLDAECCDLLHRACAAARDLLEDTGGRTRNRAAAAVARLDALAAELARAGCPGEASSGTEQPAAHAGHEALRDEAQQQADARDGAAVPAAMHDPDLIRVRASNLDALRHQAEALLAVELRLHHQVAELAALAEEMAARDKRRPYSQSPSSAPNIAPAPPAHAADFAQRAQRLAAGLGRTRHNLAGIRTRLTDAALETALVPISAALAMLPALVRQMARDSAKQAVLDIEAGAMQVDRRILEVARDALVHLVTNAVDHGLETPVRRRAAGKPETGRIRLRVAQPTADRVTFEVADDGCGIDVDALLRSALQSGLIDEAQTAGLDRQQALRLALQSGVSTSARVTRVSGRGVGLAIVAEKVAAIGGELLIDSEPGAGCRFALVLPVRLTTLRGVVLQVQAARYVLPLAGVEAVRALAPDELRTVEGRETLLHAGRVLPAVRLGCLVGRGRPAQREGHAVMVRAGGRGIALLADEILAEQEILPKGLGRQLRRVRYISGAAQLGDGSLALILSINDIARHGLHAPAAARPGPVEPDEAPPRILVVEDSVTSRLLLKHILEGAGYTVDTAGDGREALSKLQQEDWQAVVSDIEMPHLDGLELTARIRAAPHTAELPVVLVTSLESAQEKQRGLEAGADAYLAKGSFDQDILLKTIRRLT